MTPTVPPQNSADRLASDPDILDTLLMFTSLVTGFAIGNMPGLLGGFGLFWAVRILRQTPIIPATWRFFRNVFAGDKSTLDGIARVIFPAMQDDAPPQNPSRPVAADAAPAGLRATVSVPPPVAAPALTRTPVSRYRGLTSLPDFPDRQIIVYGPTGGGKSSVLRILLDYWHARGAHAIVLDPHYKPGEWQTWVTLAGKGRDFDTIAQVIQWGSSLLTARYQQRANGFDAFAPVYIVVDELSTLVEAIPNAAESLLEIAREGRKVKVFVVLTPHSAQVADLGIEGRGENRENFIFIKLPQVTEAEKHLPRIVDVFYGNPHRRGGNEPAGRYIIPAPKPVTGEPNFNVQAFMQGVGGGVPGTVPGTGPGTVPGGVPNTFPAGNTFRNTLRFESRFSRNADDTRDLVCDLLGNGFGNRRIAEFLPFRLEDARALVEEIRATLTDLPEAPPAAGTTEELALVRYLANECRAPLERIAALLHGNTHDNLNRIRAYGL
ncbi:MAG: hypothetical protein OHK0052_20600 [Anaerolineales bacterium]